MSKQPKPFPSLKRNVGDVKGQQKRQQNSSPFSGTAFSVPAPGVTNVEGDLVFTDGEARSGNFSTYSTGWRLPQNGTPEFNDLRLRGGIIGNDALSNPVEPVAAHADASGFSASAAWSTVMTATVTVPAGFTRALILSLATNASVLNGSGSEDWLYVSANIPAYGGGLPGYVTSSPNVPAGNYGSAYDFRSVVLTGLSGSFTITGQVSTDLGSWGSNASNTANLDASILFLR